VALGTFTLVSTLMHPMLVAEQSAVIDNLSRGRFFLSMARGYHDTYWRHFGVPQERLLGQHLEAVAIVQKALKGERFTYDGAWWSVEDSLLTPQAYQPGGFPIWGAGDSPPAMVRAATYGEAWCCSPFPLQKEMWEETVGAYRAKARALGKEPFVVLMRDGWVADDFASAARVFGQPYVEDMSYYARQGILDHQGPRRMAPRRSPRCRPRSASRCTSSTASIGSGAAWCGRTGTGMRRRTRSRRARVRPICSGRRTWSSTPTSIASSTRCWSATTRPMRRLCERAAICGAAF
jgi:alkanesulfonate monooxygenase SsuD/methylene tetrahydromethanopterin reductase-like flavin-dependent oxidoreductase (luciferase family)